MQSPHSLEPSPTTSAVRVFMTLGTAFIVAILLDARGIVHSGEGMQDGRVRDVTLQVGQRVLQVSQAAHLTWPWDQLQAALGHDTPSSETPLLASSAPPPVSKPRSIASRAPLPPVTVSRGSRNSAGGRQPLRLHRQTRTRARHRVPTLRVPTPRNPLHLLTTGDSLMGYIGPQLVDEVSHVGPIQGFVEVHDGTGLTRPDFVDWSTVAQQQVAAHHPDAVVVLIGGNDFQNMTLPGGKFFLAGTAAWMREYERRAAICMRIWAQGGTRRVYWLSMLPARDPSWAHDDGQINVALQRAASQVPGAEYLNILGPVTDHGRYADFVQDGRGESILVRQPDGVHLNITGSDMVANEVLPVIVRDWHLHWPPAPKHHRKVRRHRTHR